LVLRVNPEFPRHFDHFAAIDWSGAKGPRQKGIAVALCSEGTDAPVPVRPGHIWSRQEVLHWLRDDMPPGTLAGFDLSPAFPFADAGAYFPGWAESPANARALWALVDRICTDDPHFEASAFVDHPQASRHFRRHGGRTGDMFGTGRGRLRVVEQREADQRRVNPYSCLNLIGAAQVGKSSLTGMRLFHRLGGRLPVWPFDPVPQSGSLIVEIYTSIAAIDAGLRKGRTKMRDGLALDRALDALGVGAHAPLPRYDDHLTDAILTAAWLRARHRDERLWNPPGLDAVRHTEGWTFGVS
jgi:hypothetical protein